MIYCPECGASNDALARTCVQCRKSLPKIAPTPITSVVYCPNCGTANHSQASECVQCKTALPKLNVSTPPSPTAISRATYPPSPLPLTPQPVASDSFWQRLGPDIRAAILTSFVVSGVQALSSVVPGLGFAFSAPFAVIAYYIQGIATGKLTKSDSRYKHYKAGDYARLGAMSAVWTSVVISTVLTLIVLVAQFALSLGSIVVLIPIILISRLADIFLNVCFSTLGAWLYGRSGGQGVLGISIGVLGCGIALVCLLSILVLALLGVIGMSIFQGISGWLGG